MLTLCLDSTLGTAGLGQLLDIGRSFLWTCGALERDFESPKSGGRVAASLVRSRGGPNGPPSLVAGLLAFPFVGEARAA